MREFNVPRAYVQAVIENHNRLMRGEISCEAYANLSRRTAFRFPVESGLRWCLLVQEGIETEQRVEDGKKEGAV